MSEYSTELWERAQTVIPGGVNSPVRAFGGVGRKEPLFFTHGEGPYLFDINGKQYVDFVCSWGPLILGHAHPRVIEAVSKAVGLGLSFGAPTLQEVEMAELITKLMPSIEQVRLVSSGTEASQTAIRLARGATKRNKILKFEGCYHGHVDSLLVKAGSGQLTFGLPDSPGVPAMLSAETLVIPFNDLEKLETVFKADGEQLAAVIVEPIVGNMNCVLPLPDFLPRLRALTEQYGVVLIFDEVITGFRVALGGAQSLYQITPDLTCLGKIIGGGLPLAAFGGKRKLMSQLAPIGPVYQAGTLSGNPVAVAAGLATLKGVMKLDFHDHLSLLTHTFTEGFKELAARFSIPLHITEKGGLFGFLFTEQESITCYEDVAKSNLPAFRYFFNEMLKEGVYFAPSMYEAAFMSDAHASVLDFTLNKVEKIFRTWKA